jgi:NHLM bacteriocin system ABC transporter peptidase/ATP-binding protein
MTRGATARRAARARVPTMLQMEAVECGAASLGMILGYYGRFVPLEELRIACGVSRDGSRAINMVKAGRSYGLDAHGYSWDVETVLKGPFPLIVFWEFNHFLVVEGSSGNRVYLNDPASGHRVLSREEFSEGFTGVALTFAPSESFEKGGKKPSVLHGFLDLLSIDRGALRYLVLASLLLVIPAIIIPGFSKVFTDSVVVAGQSRWVEALLIGLALTMVLRLILAYCQQQVMLRWEMRLALATSAQFMWFVLRLPMAFFGQRYAGDIVNRVGANDRLASLAASDLGTSILNTLVAALYLVVMVFYDLTLTLVTLGFALLNLIVLFAAYRGRTDQARRSSMMETRLFGVSATGLRLIDTLRVTGSEDEYFSKWSGTQADMLNAQQRLALYNQITAVIPVTLMMLNTAVILGLGGYFVIRGAMTVGELVAFQTLAASFAAPIQQLVAVSGKFQGAAGDIAILRDVLHYPVGDDGQPESPAARTGKRTVVEGKLEMKDVTFGYSKTLDPLIEGFNLSLEPGMRVGIVGPTGSGKSTTTRLITGLYKPWSGEILVDGTPLEKLDPELRHAAISAVDQDIRLFHGTIRDNLTLWDDSVDDTALISAARDAQIMDEIASRQGGFDDLIEQDGRNFSGGQRQRLEIARALVSDPSILVLDEATSALDAEVEQAVQDALRRRGCTMVIVAHRLSTIRDCDEIIVLDQGRVVERGSHATLMAADGTYAKLVTSE